MPCVITRVFLSIRMLMLWSRLAQRTAATILVAASVQKVGGFAAEQLDGVHRRHREAGAVDETADVAVEADVAEVELARFDLGRILLVEISVGDDLGVTEQRIRIEVELRVERFD